MKVKINILVKKNDSIWKEIAHCLKPTGNETEKKSVNIWDISFAHIWNTVMSYTS